MYGILEVGTGKVFAKSKKNGIDFGKLFQSLVVAYPNKQFKIEKVSNEVICVGDVPKKVTFEKKKKGSV